MASLREHDIETVRAQLEAWLADHAGLASPVVGPVHLPTTGAVNDTFVYDVTWGGGAFQARHVLRAQPDGFSNLRDNDVIAQACFLRELAERTDLPVPHVLWIDEDGGPFGRPLYVMDALPGEVATDVPPYSLEGWLGDLAPSARRGVYRQAVDAIAAVHDVAWESMTADALVRAPRDAAGALVAQMEEFFTFAQWGAQGVEYPTLDAAAAWLRERRPTPTGRAVLTWNDGRLGNMLFDDARLSGVLDWELVTVGPPEVDLAWCLWHDRFSAECLASMLAGRPVSQLAGAPDLEQGAAWYAETSGHEPADLEWYAAWSAYRMAVYLMRHGKGLLDAGLAPPESRVDHVNIASIELARMLGLEPPH